MMESEQLLPISAPESTTSSSKGSLLSRRDDRKRGKRHGKDNISTPFGVIIFWVGLWYTASLVTLFTNKYILSYLNAEPSLLALVQMVSTAVYGAAKVHGPTLIGAKHLVEEKRKRWKGTTTRTFAKDMLIVGIMRFATVMLGLIAIEHVAVSFVETIKASAPFFTVFIARVILQEITPTPVVLTLIPVATGLAMASSAELSFNYIGFLSACLCNCIDCIQNVFSKKLLSGPYTSVELQFYTSAAALVVQFPLFVYRYSNSTVDEDSDAGLSNALMLCLIIDGISYHLQSVFAYKVMSYISPVTMSVINTAKRSILICLSVAFFGNSVTPLTGFGTAVCIMGVFLYNHVRQGGTLGALSRSITRIFARSPKRRDLVSSAI